MADLEKRYHLAVSLHASNDSLRDRLVPVNRKIGIEAILAAADYFFQRTGRQVTYEHVLLRGVNDRPMDAQALATLLRGRKAHVNLIPFNPVSGLPYSAPGDKAINRFQDILVHGGVSVTVRKRKGVKIDAGHAAQRHHQSLRSEEPAGVDV